MTLLKMMTKSQFTIKYMLKCDNSYKRYHYATTRGHDFRLQKIRTRYDLRKYYFTNRVVITSMWYSLSSYRYVVSAESVNCFENRLDNFWKDQIIYNFRAEIYGTGNSSEVTV